MKTFNNITLSSTNSRSNAEISRDEVSDCNFLVHLNGKVEKIEPIENDEVHIKYVGGLAFTHERAWIESDTQNPYQDRAIQELFNRYYKEEKKEKKANRKTDTDQIPNGTV